MILNTGRQPGRPFYGGFQGCLSLCPPSAAPPQARSGSREQPAFSGMPPAGYRSYYRCTASALPEIHKICMASRDFSWYTIVRRMSGGLLRRSKSYGKSTALKRRNMNDSREIDSIMEEICADPRVQEMKRYIQHGRVTTYEHCRRVTGLSLKIDRRLHLHSDLPTLVRGAMLHDFYLYYWHNEDNGEHNWHGYIHAERARKNAQKYMGADKRVQDVIYSHMWPLNLTRIPASREAWIVCLADKFVSLKETFLER